MQWTKQLPTQPGWYWVKIANGPAVRKTMIYVGHHGPTLVGRQDEGHALQRIEAMINVVGWSGPIPQPEEDKEEKAMPIAFGRMRWTPVVSGHEIPNPLSDYLANHFRDLGSGPNHITLTRIHDKEARAYLRGLRDAGVSGAQELIDAIENGGGVTITLE